MRVQNVFLHQENFILTPARKIGSIQTGTDLLPRSTLEWDHLINRYMGCDLPQFRTEGCIANEGMKGI